MMFLSWGGKSGTPAEGTVGAEDLSGRLLHSLRSLHACGVAYRDLRPPNVLLNKETGQTMIIDFERAFLIDPPRPPLASLALNKRKRSIGIGRAAGKRMSQGSLVGKGQQLLRDDTQAAIAMFTGLLSSS